MTVEELASELGAGNRILTSVIMNLGNHFNKHQEDKEEH